MEMFQQGCSLEDGGERTKKFVEESIKNIFQKV